MSAAMTAATSALNAAAAAPAAPAKSELLQLVRTALVVGAIVFLGWAILHHGQSVAPAPNDLEQAVVARMKVEADAYESVADDLDKDKIDSPEAFGQALIDAKQKAAEGLNEAMGGTETKLPSPSKLRRAAEIWRSHLK